MSSHRDEETIFENFDWNRLSLEQLKRLQSEISKAIALKRRALTLSQAASNQTQIQSYKASLSRVFPHELRHSLSEYQRCVFIVSLGSKNFIERQRLDASIRWIGEHFNVCVILVGDSIYRLTISVRNGLKPDENRLEALQTGQEFIQQNYPLFQHYSERCRFQFRLASEIEQETDFEAYYQQFQALYCHNDAFQAMVNAFAQTYLNRNEQIEATQAEPRFRQQTHLAITYLLEELALFTCLAKAGWSVFVYPGSIKTFEEIAAGKHPDVPLPLKQAIWVSLRLKKKAT